MPVQDDRREEFLRQLFRLKKPEGSGRSGTDASLFVPAFQAEALFELKSATREGVTTVRDFGPDHIKKWKGKHWLIGFFDTDGKRLQRCIYASPQQMAPWIALKEAYIRPDFELAELARRVDPSLFEEVLTRILGDKEVYTLADAKRIQKKQYTTKRYRDLMDLPEGYSKAAMRGIFAERWVYLTKRGSTLNNPHIPSGYFNGFEPLPLERMDLILPVPDSVIAKARVARDDLLRRVSESLTQERNLTAPR